MLTFAPLRSPQCAQPTAARVRSTGTHSFAPRGQAPPTRSAVGPGCGGCSANRSTKRGILRADLGLWVFETEIAISLHTRPGDDQVERLGNSHRVITSRTFPALPSSRGVIVRCSNTDGRVNCHRVFGTTRRFTTSWTPVRHTPHLPDVRWLSIGESLLMSSGVSGRRPSSLRIRSSVSA